MKDDGDDISVGIIIYFDKLYLRYRFDDNIMYLVFGIVLDKFNLIGKGRNIGKVFELVKIELFNCLDEYGNIKGWDIFVVLIDDGLDDDLVVFLFVLKWDKVIIFSVGVGWYLCG